MGAHFQSNVYVGSSSFHFSFNGSKAEYGITVVITEEGDVHSANITVEGREYNNNTEIDCKVWSSSYETSDKSGRARLILVGKDISRTAMNLSFFHRSTKSPFAFVSSCGTC